MLMYNDLLLLLLLLGWGGHDLEGPTMTLMQDDCVVFRRHLDFIHRLDDLGGVYVARALQVDGIAGIVRL